jgi:hypothetical protein
MVHFATVPFSPARNASTLLLLLTAGCGADSSLPLPTGHTLPRGPSGAVDSGAGSGTTDASPPGATPDSLSTATEIAATLESLLLGDVPNGTEFIDLFRDLTSQGDGACPGDDHAFTTPESSCMSSTGWEYFGFAPFLDEISSVTGDNMHAVGIPQASFVITAPDGRTLSVGGGFLHLQSIDGSGIWEQVFTATVIWTGEGYPWMQAGTQLGWTITGVRTDARHSMSIQGPIAVGASWVYIHNIEWDSTVCDGLPTVDLQVRDAEGHWYDWASGHDCSPCSMATYTAPDGSLTELGEICLDLTETMRTIDTKNDFPEPG